MSFPASPRVVYHNNPLAEVICQLRFPPILEIAARVPADFQNSIRESYPLYEKEGIAAQLPKEIGALINQLGGPSQQEQITHKFLNPDRTRFVSLAQDFLAVTFTDYLRWEEFREQLLRATAALEEFHRPAFYNRVGLRYVDIIDRSTLGLETTPWSDLIRDSMTGLLAMPDLADRLQAIQSNALMRLDDVPGGSVMLRYGLATRSPDGPVVFLLDADLYTEERSEHDDATQRLDSFNRTAGYLFRWAITERLHDALQPEPVE